MTPTNLTAGLDSHRRSAALNDPDDQDRLLVAYDYNLPKERIAQDPVVPRDDARLLVVNSLSHQHLVFRDLPDLLQPGDLLVLNNTCVIPARLFGRSLKTDGGSVNQQDVEVLLLEEQINGWLALVKPGKRLKPGAWIEFGPPDQPSLRAKVLEVDPLTRGRVLQFERVSGECLKQKLHQLGQVPLPPYIKNSQAQPEQYQTVYASQPGAVAAPTAGLHFTPELLLRLQKRGIRYSFITLHVGAGTFRHVEAEDITTHLMHPEWVDVPAETVQQVHLTQANGGRVIAVGTTTARALETAASDGLRPYRGKTKLFIYPGYRWQVVTGLLTNFHIPRSSLLMLVSALVGRQRLMELYQIAIAEQYRFYSFGDAMLILPQSSCPESLSEAQP